jgi:hypothetical protein
MSYIYLYIFLYIYIYIYIFIYIYIYIYIYIFFRELPIETSEPLILREADESKNKKALAWYGAILFHGFSLYSIID